QQGHHVPVFAGRLGVEVPGGARHLRRRPFAGTLIEVEEAWFHQICLRSGDGLEVSIPIQRYWLSYSSWRRNHKSVSLRLWWAPPPEAGPGRRHPSRGLYACRGASGARETAGSVTS